MPIFRKPDSNKTLGVEVECFLNRGIEEPQYYTHYGFWYVQEDGSLIRPSWDHNAYELVSQPLPAEWLKKEVHKLYRKLSPTVNESCGLHIHVNRKWLSEQRALLIAKFIKGLQREQVIELFGRYSERYADPAELQGRYVAVNRTNSETVEFRLFAASDKPEWVCYCVDLAVYLIQNAKRLNIDAIMAFYDQYKVRP